MTRLSFLVFVVFVVLVGHGSCRVIPDLFEQFIKKSAGETPDDGDSKGGKIWALLVAGSSGWFNYRHQSDICHAYHMLTKHHGIPKQQVIVMMYNDIAGNHENPYPGKIINALHGKDVYKGVVIDYEGEDVNPETFLRVLRGQPVTVGSKRVVQSGPKDHIFVNFVDHGDVGVLGFPNDELHLVDLKPVLHEMYLHKSYKQMLWYVEACFSGSMFADLSSKVNMTAATAANAKESSWACVWSDDIGVFLGDCWSLNWMNNTEHVYPKLGSETVEKQYEVVRKMTTKSHPRIYGDLSTIYHEPISDFMGHGKTVPYDHRDAVESEELHLSDSISTPDVLLRSMRRRLEATNDAMEQQELVDLVSYHERSEMRASRVIGEIVAEVVGDSRLAKVIKAEAHPIHHPSCNKAVLDAFYNQCYGLQRHPYITKYTFALANLCNWYKENRVLETVLIHCNAN